MGVDWNKGIFLDPPRKGSSRGCALLVRWGGLVSSQGEGGVFPAKGVKSCLRIGGCEGPPRCPKWCQVGEID